MSLGWRFKVRYCTSWQQRPHPYWFFRNFDTLVVLHLGPFEFYYYKKYKESL